MSFKDVTRAWVLALLNLRERLGASAETRRKFEEKGDLTPENAEYLLLEYAREMARGKVTTYPRLPSAVEVEAHQIFFPAECGVGWWVLVGPDGIPEVYLLGTSSNSIGRRSVYAMDRATRREIPLPQGITLAVPIKVLP